MEEKKKKGCAGILPDRWQGLILLNLDFKQLTVGGENVVKKSAERFIKPNLIRKSGSIWILREIHTVVDKAQLF